METENKTWNEAPPNHLMKDRKTSWADSLNLEAAKVSITSTNFSKLGWRTTLSLAFQSIGIVYGDIGTSPLYVFSGIFTEGIRHNDDILGILSLIIYTIVTIPMVKYVFIVLHANDHGNGGAFALYSLICRHAKVSLIPNQQPEDMELSNYRLETPSNKLIRAQKLKQKLENSYFARVVLVLVTMVGTSMVIGDGIFTPAMSVLSAVSGISTSLGQEAVVGISVVILVVLFSMQQFGTDKVGSSFAPILLLWFSFISGIGLYNLFKHDIGILRAFNPKYIVDYFKRNGKQGWVSFGGVFLCITGSEAMFADLGHFSVRAIQISFSFVVFPAILIAYIGQAAYLRKFPEKVSNTFYASIPGNLYWPTFVVAVAAAVIASQAMISGAFSVISQAQSLGCFPRVKVVHTSTKHKGQVYIPEVNYMFMIACIVVTVAFKTSANMSHAYGIAVVCDMLITTTLVSLIMFVIWKKSIWVVALFLLIGCVELLYFSSQLTKFIKGGFIPLLLAFFLSLFMGIWHYVQKERYIFELKNKVSTEYMRKLANNPNINRVPGIGLLYSELVQGIPPIFPHFIANIPSIHSVVVFVSIKAIPIATVALEERFLFRQVEPREYKIFRCVVRHGYSDVLGDHEEFESQLVQHLKEFIREESFMLEAEGKTTTDEQAPTPGNENERADTSNATSARVDSDEGVVSRASSDSIQLLGVAKEVEKEIEFIEKAMENGVVYMLGEADVVADPKSSIFNKIVVNYAYNVLRKNFREGDKSMAIPRNKLLKLGWSATLSLAFHTIGIIYGDIGTSPLYVFSSIFIDGISNNDDILGVLSLIIYTIVTIPLLKYVFIVLHANDNGNGGAFALYSLICRHAKVSLIPNQQPEDNELSNYRLQPPSNNLKIAQKLKQKLESSYFAQVLLVLVTMMGSSMVIGDGIFTPSMSDAFVGITFIISNGMVNKDGYHSVESFYASQYRLHILEAAYLRKFPGKVSNTFYECIPGHFYWPTFVVAVAAAIIASQAMISGAFSVISQAQSLDCFPRVKVVHTSTKHKGQVYIPEVNYMFMIACTVVTVAFKTSANMSHAYGIAVVCDMLITTTLVSLIMLVIWKKSIWVIALFLSVGCIELLYLSSQLTKFTNGGFVPLLSAFFLTVFMRIWHYVQKERYMFEFKNKVSTEYVRKLVNKANINRMPGIGLLYSELAIPIATVALEERFLLRQVEPREYRVFSCVVRHGYRDVLEDHVVLESQLVQQLKEFIRKESFMLEAEGTTTIHEQEPTHASSNSIQPLEVSNEVEKEVEFIEKAMENGVVYMVGEAEVVADPKSSIFNKIVVNYAYSFLRSNFRQPDNSMSIPPNRLLKYCITK
ncbi:Potassium transporter 5, partial [Mucuna pruriens]